MTRISPFSPADTMERLRRAVLDRGLTIFALFDHSGEAERAGLHMQEAKVIVFGNPRAGTPLMVEAPLLALELPLRVLVWEDPDGRCLASYPDPAALAERFGITGDLVANIGGIEGLVGSALGPAYQAAPKAPSDVTPSSDVPDGAGP